MGDLASTSSTLSTAAAGAALLGVAAFGFCAGRSSGSARKMQHDKEADMPRKAAEAAESLPASAAKQLTPAGVAWAQAAATHMASSAQAAAKTAKTAAKTAPATPPQDRAKTAAPPPAAAPRPATPAAATERRQTPPPAVEYSEEGPVQTIVVVGLSMVGWKFCEVSPPVFLPPRAAHSAG